jgi:O-antigen/teichoic acid export membrane protein
LNDPTQASSTTLKTRLLKGTGAQAFGQGVQIFIRLAEVPLLLVFWGTQLYGEWLMLSAIPAYLSIGDGGFAEAACRDMTMKSGAGDRQGVLAVFQSTWLLLLAVSLVAFLLAYGFAELAPLDTLLGFSAMNAADTQTVLLLLVAHVLVGFQGGLLNGGFWVSGKYPTGMVLSAVTQLLEFLGLGLAVILGGGPVQAAAGYLGGKVLGTGLMWIGQQRASSWLRYGFAHASLSELRRLTVPAFASLAFPLGNALNIQGMRLVVGLALGPAAVAVFAPLRTLSRLVMQPRAVINHLIQPEMALAFGADDTSLFQRLFTKSCQLAFWGGLLAALMVGAGAHWVFPAWTSGKVVMQWPAFILLLAGALVNSLWYTALMVPYATNRHVHIAVFYSLIYGAGAFVMGYVGAKGLGLSGAVLALMIVEIVMAAIVIRAALKMTKIKTTFWLKSTLQPPLKIVGQSLVGLFKRMIAEVSQSRQSY